MSPPSKTATLSLPVRSLGMVLLKENLYHSQHPEKDGAFEVRESSICQRVFVHATESNDFLKVFHALCENPNTSHRRVRLHHKENPQSTIHNPAITTEREVVSGVEM
ncbi:unnamed protein product [Choristocarpus tenellus]